MVCSLQMEDSEGTVRQIGAFSEGINNLTVSCKTNFKCSSKKKFDSDPKGLLVQWRAGGAECLALGVYDSHLLVFQHMLKEDEMFKDFAARSPSASITDEDSNV